MCVIFAGPKSASAALMMSPETIATLSMLKASMICSPENSDSDKGGTYSPRNPYMHSHPAFPTQQLSRVESAALFERLPMDALFFAFYYQVR